MPERIDGWLYYHRTESRRPVSHLLPPAGDADDAAAEEILLDLNPLAEGHAYFRLGAFEVSPDHRMLAYAVDTSGAESFTLYVKDLATGALLAETIANVSPSVAWANDSRTLFYVVLDEARRPCRLYRHRLGDNPADDALVHFEADESFFMDVARTRSHAWLLLELASHSTSEVRYVSADRPDEPFRTIEPRRAGVEYSVSHHGDRFFITTNDGAPNFRLVSAPVTRPVARALDRDAAAPARGQGGLDRRVPGSPGGLRARGRAPADPDPGAGPRAAPSRGDHLVALSRAGLHRPPAREPRVRHRPAPLHLHLDGDAGVGRGLRHGGAHLDGAEADRGARRLRPRALPHRSGCSPRRRTGRAVPISLVYQLPLERPGGPRPLLLNGYGAYGISYDPAFSSSSLSLLDRGFVVAIAHVRGGEEMGRPWYDGGKLLNKPNSFTDFIAAAEHLIAEGYTSPDRLAISGGSAGGLLMGAVTNLRPDLFRAVLAEVPFVDVVNTMLDASLPLTVIEYDEWGNPNDPAYYACIRVVLAVRQRAGAGVSRTCWSRRGSTIRGWPTGSRPSSRRGSGR